MLSAKESTPKKNAKQRANKSKVTPTPQGQAISVKELFEKEQLLASGGRNNTTPEKAPKLVRGRINSSPEKASTTPARGRNNVTPPATQQRRLTQRSPTSSNYATPAYADSPKASELPPPPVQWMTPKSNVPTKKTQSNASLMTQNLTPSFTGMDLIRQLALAAQ